MPYEDAGLISSDSTTRTSWGNQVRNNQQDHESRISQNESDISQNASDISQNASDISDLESGGGGLQIVDDWIAHKASPGHVNSNLFFHKTMNSNTNYIKIDSHFSHYDGRSDAHSIIEKMSSSDWSQARIRTIWSSSHWYNSSHQVSHFSSWVDLSSWHSTSYPLSKHPSFQSSQISELYICKVYYEGGNLKIAFNYYSRGNAGFMDLMLFGVCYQQ